MFLVRTLHSPGQQAGLTPHSSCRLGVKGGLSHWLSPPSTSLHPSVLGRRALGPAPSWDSPAISCPCPPSKHPSPRWTERESFRGQPAS